MATTTPRNRISSYFNQISNPAGGLSSLFNGTSAPSNKISQMLLANSRPSPLSSQLSTQKIPDGPMSYRTEGPIQPSRVAPTAAPAGATPSPIFSGAGGSRGTAAPSPVGASPVSSNIPPQWLNPDGTLKSPEQIAGEVGSTLKNSQGSGDIGTLAGQQFGGEGKTAEQLRAETYQINNIRNDIAVGETDPYKVGSKSGIAYTPAELNAIEKAYAGIYDPHLTTALAKVEAKQIEDEASRKSASDLARDERQNAFELQKMDRQFGYDKALKGMGTGGGSSSGAYVPGENPIVDSWAQRIFDGSAKITDIPAAQAGLRSAVVVALQSTGNDLMGRPTATELGVKAREAAEDLKNKLLNREGTSAVGGSRVFGGSLALPGTDKRDFVIDFQNLKDMLSLEGTRYLKGQGQVSDAERALLASAVTRLNLSQSEGEFETVLDEIISTLSGTNPDLSTDPNAGNLPPSMILNGQTLYLQADGTYE